MTNSIATNMLESLKIGDKPIIILARQKPIIIFKKDAYERSAYKLANYIVVKNLTNSFIDLTCYVKVIALK